MISLTDQMIYRLGNLNTEQQRISYQMSTGKLLDRGSDDSSIFARELYVNDKIRTYEGLQTQIEKTAAQNSVSDSSISEMKTLLDKVKQDMLQALNAGMDPADKKATAINLQGIKENFITLANEKVDGEYIFAGSNTTVRPFTKDSVTGIVTYNGDGISRKVAVEPNTYRDRGVTGLDVLYYNASEASDAVALDFYESETVIDSSGLEWIQPIASTGSKLTFDLSDATGGNTILDNAANAWTLNTTTNKLESGAFSIDVVNLEGNKWQTTDLIGATTTGPSGTVTSLTVTNAASNLRQMGTNGVLTSKTLAISSNDAGTPPKYTTAAVNTSTSYIEGTTFNSKHSVFEDIDDIITALNTNDNTSLTALLDKVDDGYDGVNVAHSKLGGRNKIFELALESVGARLTHFNIMSQEIGSADLSKVAMEAKALEMTYTALYSTITKMNNLSLVNFVR